MRRSARQLELVSAEAMGWLAGGLLGFAMLVAFIFARLIRDTSWAPVAHYVDPGLVIVTCLAFVVPPLQMIRTTFFELVEGTPDTELNQPAREAVDKVAADYALTEHHLRMTKIGRKFYVEIDFVVAPEWTVWQSDQVRRDLSDTLDQLHLDLWLTLEFTADHSWGL
jgi:predicted Co/Zn/Cd cation transporter (cation efflux family)